jgi:hypothetical protein
MQALIVRDYFDCKESYEDLKIFLKDFKIYEINSIRNFEEIKNLLDSDKPCLFFLNVFVRFSNHLMLYDFHSENNFSCIMAGETIISFIPSKTKLNDKKNYIVCPGNIFRTTNVNIITKILDRPPVDIFMLTYGRNDYLKITLNSLIYNIDTKCNIKIGLNTDDSESERILKEYQNKYPFIEVIKFSSNTVLSGYNLLYQIFKPDRFIIMEDDFILPGTFKSYYPNWINQFVDRLDYFDVVAAGATLDNSPYDWALERNVLNGYIPGDWEIVNDLNKKFLMGQLFSIKSEFFLKIIKKYYIKNEISNTKKYLTPTDKEIYAESKKICSPSLRGYHIGWNEYQDGLKKSYDKYLKPSNNYQAKSLKNLKEYDLVVDRVLEL